MSDIFPFLAPSNPLYSATRDRTNRVLVLVVFIQTRSLSLPLYIEKNLTASALNIMPCALKRFNRRDHKRLLETAGGRKRSKKSLLLNCSISLNSTVDRIAPSNSISSLKFSLGQTFSQFSIFEKNDRKIRFELKVQGLGQKRKRFRSLKK